MEMRKETSILLSLLLVAVFVFVYALSTGAPATQASHLSPATGYAWSSNIGWISFSCQDIDDLCDISNYKVHLEHIDAVNFRVRGHAWSSNVGWISFEPTPDLVGCPAGICEARVSGTEFTGWAKVLSTGEFISLNCSNTSSCGVSNYKVGFDESSGEASGYAWGAGVVGWISFNCSDTGTCISLSDYKVVFPAVPPDADVCQDIDATNFGEPLPCTYPPGEEPATSTIIKGCEVNPGGAGCPKKP